MKICLDPGHGGKDRWNVGPNGYVEADGCLDIVLKTGKILEQHGIEVIYTRTTDINLSWEGAKWRDLRSRANFANTQKVDYYVSIHTNAGSATGRGTETICYKKGGQAEKLANTIQNELIKSLGLKDRGIKEGNLAVLRLTKMPAVLTEVAFHSNPEEEKLLLDSSFRQRAANAIAKGILNFLNISYKNESEVIHVNEKSWQQVAGEKAIDSLKNKGFLANADDWKNQDLMENTPLWLFFEIMNRLSEVK